MNLNLREIIIWLDSNAVDPLSSFRNKLPEGPFECVKMFIEMEECLKYIQTNVDQMIILILSHSFGSKLVPLIYDLKNLYQIYLFSDSNTSDKDWTINYTDKILIFNHQDDLLKRLFTEMELYLRKQAQILNEQAKICKDRAQLLKQSSCG